MTKRKKGQTPYTSDHPHYIGIPDVPGHKQRRRRITLEQKREMERQIEVLAKELNIPTKKSGVEKEG